MTMENERYCSIRESLIESCKEVKLMREGKLPKRNWADTKKKLEKIRKSNGITN